MSNDIENSSISIDDLDSVSGGARVAEPRYRRGDCVIVPGYHKHKNGSSTPRRFMVYSINVVGNAYEYTLIDNKDPNFQLTGIHEEEMRPFNV